MQQIDILWVLLSLTALNVILALWVLLRKDQARTPAWLAELEDSIASSYQKLRQDVHTLIQETSRQDRDELGQSIWRLQQLINAHQTDAARNQNSVFETVVKQLSTGQEQLSEHQLKASTLMSQQLTDLNEGNTRRMGEIRTVLGEQLKETRELVTEHLQRLQTSNEAKLEEMRKTVDEKLHDTLEKRVSESFKQVAERLEQVHQGLGEMHKLAQGVGDLKGLLSNVKTRGVFGEVQLEQILEQVLTVEQYQKQVKVNPSSNEVVDFAIALPGKKEMIAPCWLPIDAKFPTEDYERLLRAQKQVDAEGVKAAGRALEQRIKQEAKSISEKYISPPYTTDFAILFLPSEGLYAEVLRRPGLIEFLQRNHQVVIAGPTTVLALLNSLQMGFRTLALEKRSAEVWRILGAVKTEFGKFNDVLLKMKSQLQTVSNSIDTAQTRTRVMGRALKQVEQLPEEQVQKMLPSDEALPQKTYFNE